MIRWLTILFLAFCGMGAAGSLPFQERDGGGAVRVTYTRGLDLSGSLQGAGGIGGLLARTDASGSTFYHADASGNITGLMDAQGNMAARYLYGPFGRRTAQWGPLASSNVMQFSSMPLHARSGLSLYPLRAYDPGLQRWTARDPAGEAAGVNLYGFADNDPLGLVDPLGLEVDSSEFLGSVLAGVLNPIFNGGVAIFQLLLQPIFDPPEWPDCSQYHIFQQPGPFGMPVVMPNDPDGSSDPPMDPETFQEVKQALDGVAAALLIGLLPEAAEAGAANAAARTFSSTDPLVGQLANDIEAAYPGHVVGVNVPLQSALGTTDADILLQNAVIQVKSGGSAQGLLLQLQKSEAATGLPSIGFGPNLPANSLRTLSQQGGLVTADRNLLLQVVKP